MTSGQENEALSAHGLRLLQIRSHLAVLCEQIAGVEDSLALTLNEIARTAPKQRADRLRRLAAAAQDFAVTERARAREYDR